MYFSSVQVVTYCNNFPNAWWCHFSRNELYELPLILSACPLWLLLGSLFLSVGILYSDHMKSGLVNEPVWPVTSTITEFIFIPRRQQKPSSSEMMMPFQTTHSCRRKAIVQSRESNHSHSSRMGYRIFRYCEVHKFSRFSHFIHNRDKDFGPIFIRVRFRRILRSSLFAFLLRSKLSGQAGDSHFKDDER